MTKGKNFSLKSKKRRKSDFYETPYSMTEHLLKNEYFEPSFSTLEPAMGDGAIVRVLDQNNVDCVKCYDLETDFLQETIQYDYIITNPPYSQAFEFIKHAQKIARVKFAFLLPLSYLHGQKRYKEIWQDGKYRLKTVYVFTRYPLLGEPLRDDGKYNTGMMVYAWYVWDNSYFGEPHIKWIDNNDDVLTKEDKK